MVPLREPAAVDLRARLRPGSTPLDIEELLKGSIETPIRGSPRITLEEVDANEVVLRIAATRSIHGTARGSPARCSERSLRTSAWWPEAALWIVSPDTDDPGGREGCSGRARRPS